MEIETAWVKPPPQVSGLDHLAVQAPCINIYSRLLPGITNVTDRARYYSFYPWLIWAFDQRGFTRYDSEFVERFRRADCLFSLIAERHAATAGGDYQDHAGATVGSNTLAAVARSLKEGGTIRLSDYSLREGAKARYFKNKLGGLGQYYIGVLRELTVLDGDTARGIKYTREIGQPIAERTATAVDGDLFFAVVDADEVSAAELDALSGLCPCQLAENTAEREILTDLLFGRGVFHDVEALPRRRSLQCILQLAKLLAAEQQELSEFAFRASVYSGSLASGAPWPTLDTLAGTRQKWATYSTNELLSVNTQGLFYALLDAYQDSGLRFEASTEVVDWFVTQPEVLEALHVIDGEQTFAESLRKAAKTAPRLALWSDPAHEVQLTEHVAQLSRASKSADNRRDILVSALGALIALASRRRPNANAYGDLVFDETYFRYYPANLGSFDFHTKNTWPTLSTRDVLRWLLVNWGIELHLRVALRKLRGQSQSTFRIRPSDRGLEVIEAPVAVHTRPRFNQAVRLLKDIGALQRTESGWSPSSLGLAMLELGDAP